MICLWWLLMGPHEEKEEEDDRNYYYQLSHVQHYSVRIQTKIIILNFCYESNTES